VDEAMAIAVMGAVARMPEEMAAGRDGASWGRVVRYVETTVDRRLIELSKAARRERGREVLRARLSGPG